MQRYGVVLTIYVNFPIGRILFQGTKKVAPKDNPNFTFRSATTLPLEQPAYDAP